MLHQTTHFAFRLHSWILPSQFYLTNHIRNIPSGTYFCSSGSCSPADSLSSSSVSEKKREEHENE